MSIEGWCTLAVVLVLLVALIRNWGPPDILFLGATVLFALVGIISPDQALSGFANPGMLTIGFLFVVAAGLRDTGVLDWLGYRMLGPANSERAALARLSVVVVPMSALLNNTPIVAMFLPMLIDWCRRHQVSPSKMLIPLSYMTILGGTCTLIGTSTNLIVSGLMLENGMPALGLFSVTPLGIPYALVGLVYLATLGRRLLPERKELIEQLGESRREYLLEMLVQPGCRLVGQTVEVAGLRNLPGLFLIEIDREGRIMAPAGPDDVIEANDRLVFTGVVSSILELERIHGLVPATDPSYELLPGRQRQRRLCEAVISETSPLIGKRIREADFRAVYGAAVVAVHRGGHRVERKVGDIQLRPGDTLLLQTRPHFLRTYRNDPSFYLISDVPEWRPLRRDRAWIAAALFLMLILLMSSGWIPIHIAAAAVALGMIVTGAISASEARRSIEWPVLVTIAAAFGVGTALESSGAARAVAETLVEVTRPWGPLAALAIIYLLGSSVTEVITNNAAAVLLFPFCLETAELYNVSPMPFLMALVFSASASFTTPIGYQTNMMVYGPGGYRFGDFFRVGSPLNFLLGVLAVVLIPLIWPF